MCDSLMSVLSPSWEPCLLFKMFCSSELSILLDPWSNQYLLNIQLWKEGSAKEKITTKQQANEGNEKKKQKYVIDKKEGKEKHRTYRRNRKQIER